MIGELLKIAGQCDGVRCDMAMLVLPEVFERTWGIRAAALLAAGDPARARAGARTSASWPRSTGTWNGRCSSRGSTTPTTSGSTTACATGTPGRCASTSTPGLDYQDKLARFLENHDEPRAAATFPPGVHEAAAVITFLSPGLRFFHQGQFEGRTKRISPHLGRGPDEPIDAELAAVLRPAARRPASAGRSRRATGSCSNARRPGTATGPADCFIAFAWQGPGGERLLVAVNYAANQSQCYVRLPFADLGGKTVAAAGPARPGDLRPRRRRPGDAGLVPGHEADELSRL